MATQNTYQLPSSSTTIINQVQSISHYSTTILISSTSLHEGKTKPSKKLKSWINPHIQAKICNWNHLCCTTQKNQQKWIDACREANIAVNKAKANSWKDLLHSSLSNDDIFYVWKVIWGLNRTPDTTSPNEAMSHNSRTITDTKFKANIFIIHYASVSKLHMTRGA